MQNNIYLLFFDNYFSTINKITMLKEYQKATNKQ